MAMVVQHNLTSMNANRQLGITTSAQAKSSEKLSSGYRINRAGDDAAGLKISEKMRNQVRGLNKASTNAQDGISLIQTAEGAMSETHSILQRMSELAVQGANDPNQDIDRQAINDELNALTEELDRIASTTQFNKQNLLDGTFTSKNLQVGANAGQRISISIQNMNAQTLGLKSIKGEEVNTSQTGVKPTTLNYNAYTYQYDTNKTYTSNVKLGISSVKKDISGAATKGQYALSWTSTGKSLAYRADSTGKFYASAGSALKIDVSAAKVNASNKLTSDFKDYLNVTDITADAPTVAKSTTAFTLNTPDVSSYAKANATLTAVQDAINEVSSRRSALGALQNRLEHTVANLDNIAENTQSAESRIRDTDMASEMVTYSKNNILAQAGQSMLAQANQSNQGVLSLLG